MKRLSFGEVQSKSITKAIHRNRIRWAKAPQPVFQTLVNAGINCRNQLALAAVLTVFLIVSVGEGRAATVEVDSFVDVANAGVNDSFVGKPQLFADQTILTGENQQYLAINYTVEKGDSMTGIANRFGLHVGSVLDANNIDAKDVEKIHPGQVLLIPAADSNTSLAWLDEINAEKARLAREAEEARKKAERERLARLARSSQLTRNTSRSSVSSGVTVVGKIKFSSPYPYGWCTSYAAWKGGIPGGWGNAGSWYSSAKRAGWSVGQSPRAGAVFVSNESWVGHVGYVEAVYDDGSFLVSEMNYSGFGVVSKRVIHGTGNMIGFVYGR